MADGKYTSKYSGSGIDALLDSIPELKEYVEQRAAELIDLRTKADGTAADSAGAAVREQVGALKSDLVDVQNNLLPIEVSLVGKHDYSKKLNLEMGSYAVTGYNTGTKNWCHTEILPKGRYYIKPLDGYRFNIYEYVSDTEGVLNTSTRALPFIAEVPNVFILSVAKASGITPTTITDDDINAITNGFIITKLGEKSIDAINSAYKNGNVYIEDSLIVNGSIDESSGNFGSGIDARSGIFKIHKPTKITMPSIGYKMCVAQYNKRLNYERSFIKWLYEYDELCDFTVSADSYPIYIAIGFKKVDGSECSSTNIVTLNKNLKLKTITDDIPFASISMFNSFGVVGCSWAAGTCYTNDNTGHPNTQITRTGLGWGENIARRNGNICKNYAIGGTSLRTWFNDTEESDSYGYKGLKGLLKDDAQPLYFLTWGNSNDKNVSETVNRGFIINEDTTEYPFEKVYRVGYLTDISENDDYNNYPTTFYGYYGRLIEMIKAHAPLSRIIITSPNTVLSSSKICNDFEVACKEIAEYYGLPYINLEEDETYSKYVSELVGNHPTARTYSMWSLAMERLFAKCVNKNKDYFDNYNGDVVTATDGSEWSVVE